MGNNRTGGDQDATAQPTGRRYTVAAAAEVLGISVDAMLARVKRGTVATEREGGRVYVLLDTAQDAAQDTPQTDRTTELVATLREQLEAEREANRENRRIIAALTSRIPAIEAPTESPGGLEPVEEEPQRAEPHSATGEAQEGEQRSWWRRVLGRYR